MYGDGYRRLEGRIDGMRAKGRRGGKKEEKKETTRGDSSEGSSMGLMREFNDLTGGSVANWFLITPARLARVLGLLCRVYSSLLENECQLLSLRFWMRNHGFGMVDLWEGSNPLIFSHLFVKFLACLFILSISVTSLNLNGYKWLQKSFELHILEG